MLPNKIYITGMVGTGKSTVANALSKLGMRTIDIDNVPNLCFVEDRISGARYYTTDLDYNADFVKNISYICDINKLNNILNQTDEDIFVSGSTTNQLQYYRFFDFVFLLQCNPDIFIDRIMNRDDAFGKDKSVQDLLISWHKEYERMQLMHGAIPINCEKPVDAVVVDILNCINDDYRVYLQHSKKIFKPRG